MSSIEEHFRDQVEAFLKAAGMTPTAFGKEALGDPKFVFELRGGRSCSGRTMDRVLAYISDKSPEETRRAS